MVRDFTGRPAGHQRRTCGDGVAPVEFRAEDLRCRHAAGVGLETALGQRSTCTEGVDRDCKEGLELHTPRHGAACWRSESAGRIAKCKSARTPCDWLLYGENIPR